jgi:hypothetical protein
MYNQPTSGVKPTEPYGKWPVKADDIPIRNGRKVVFVAGL